MVTVCSEPQFWLIDKRYELSVGKSLASTLTNFKVYIGAARSFQVSAHIVVCGCGGSRLTDVPNNKKATMMMIFH
jgi:hypothetical protein